MEIKNKNIKKYEEELKRWKVRYSEAVDKYIKSGLQRDYGYASWVGQYIDGMQKAYNLLLDEE